MHSPIFARIPEIWEVILTGGDPLMLSPRRLSEVMADLARIDHVKVIRIHSRVPVAEPQRINDKMVAALEGQGRRDLGGAPRQSRPGTDAECARGLCGHDRCRHSNGEPVGAAAGGQ